MSAQTGRILVIDDNENNREILARRLTGSGYTVSVMDGARGLLDRIKDEAIDLVLLAVERL